MSSISIQNLYTAYDKADVLLDVSLKVEPGTITCLLGSNGAGKTTIIRSILNLTRPRHGTIRIGDTDITGMATHKVIALGVACIPEGRRMFPKLTVVENLRLGAYQVSRESLIRERLESVFRTFPRLAERQDQLAGTMSGGEQAMVSIGRGLMSGPKILLIDEPSLGLSPLYVKENFKIIEGIRAQGVTVFLVEQNVRQTLGIADYGYVLSGGRLIAEGTAEELKASREVHAAYFG